MGPALPSPLADGVWRCGSWVVHFYLVDDGERITVVDCGLPGFRPQLDDALRRLNRPLDAIAAVVLTHGHADHVGFAEALRAQTGVPVLVHEADEQLARTQKVPKREKSMLPYLVKPATLKLFAAFARSGAVRIRGVKQLQTFAGDAALDVPGRPRAIHAPGHSDGCVALHFAEHAVLLAGDVLCEYNPLTGRRGPQIMPGAFNVSSAQALASLDRLEAIEAPVIGFGHGEPWTHGVAAALAAARHAGPS